ncbi:hypothetical protein Aoki45_08390 [Algoriphagus sp. oki45]|uniref:hypothetical protein n=1 Tax=Algoriphagus sp. oki45 TaxID=3067294 RepID=UPI0027F2E39B|nr:hypothetical protein Aoki45_08390 [Algoriphagus sp. oki45]
MKLFQSLLVMMFISLAFSCSQEDMEEVLVKEGSFKISELAGNWEATKAQYSVSSLSVDVVENGGTVSMSVQTNGRFTLRVDPINRDAYTVSGEMFWEEWQQTYRFAIRWDKLPEEYEVYAHTYDGGIFSLNGGEGSGEYDFDGDGDFEKCTVHFIFSRR